MDSVAKLAEQKAESFAEFRTLDFLQSVHSPRMSSATLKRLRAFWLAEAGKLIRAKNLGAALQTIPDSPFVSAFLRAEEFMRLNQLFVAFGELRQTNPADPRPVTVPEFASNQFWDTANTIATSTRAIDETQSKLGIAGEAITESLPTAVDFKRLVLFAGLGLGLLVYLEVT